ncbi:MAG: T9SS type A sorting domain-containing protein [Bacteroidetes bacterium]|nr:T9SS type A sorting domain-containing protein [Bacteroidota bacterium]
MVKRITPLLVCLLVASSSYAAVFNVTVTSFLFSPSSIIVEEGDTVIWKFTSGMHNVNGTTATFGSNTDNFISGVPGAVSSYTYIFTQVGTNDYQCNAHSGSMQGKVTVNMKTGIEDKIADTRKISAYRNRIIISGAKDAVVSIYDVTGRRIHHVRTKDGKYNVDIRNDGLYIVRLSNKEGVLTRKFYLR